MPWCSKFKIGWWLTCFWGLYHCYYSFFDILLFYRTTLVYSPFWFLIPSCVPKAHFLASIRTKREIMSRTPDSAARCPEHDEHPTYEEQALTTRNSRCAECPGVCRVSKIRHSANIHFAECHTRQYTTLGKQAFAECPALGKIQALGKP